MVATDQYPVIQVNLDGQIKRLTVDRLKPAPHLSEMAPFTWARTGDPIPPMEPRPERFREPEKLEDILQTVNQPEVVFEEPIVANAPVDAPQYHAPLDVPPVPVPDVAPREEVVVPMPIVVDIPPIPQLDQAVPLARQQAMPELNIAERAAPQAGSGFTGSGRAVTAPDRF